MDYTLHTLRKKIKEARNDAKMSQEELAKSLKLTGTQTISRYETGDRCPNIETVINIAEITGKELTWFFSSEESDESKNIDSNTKRFLELFNELNESGQAHILECLENAVYSKRYKK